jgi:hypothetical protein
MVLLGLDFLAMLAATSRYVLILSEAETLA